MCNLYSITTNQAAIIALFRVVNRYVGTSRRCRACFPHEEIGGGDGGRGKIDKAKSRRNWEVSNGSGCVRLAPADAIVLKSIEPPLCSA
jgi:hypothetical protein